MLKELPSSSTSIEESILGVKFSGTCPFCGSERVITTMESPCVNMSYAEVEKRCLSCHATF